MNPCEVGVDCVGKVQAHHDDYAKPLDVRWLCRRHHALWHHQHGHGLNYDLRKQAARQDGLKAAKFSCDDDLRVWLEAKAKSEDRSVASMIRVILYEAKYAEEARQLEASA